MKTFREDVDYKFLSLNEVKVLTKTKSHVSFVAVKDSEDYSKEAVKFPDDTARLNKVYYIIVMSTDRKFVGNCVDYAISKHIAGIKEWQTEINIID